MSTAKFLGSLKLWRTVGLLILWETQTSFYIGIKYVVQAKDTGQCLLVGLSLVPAGYRQQNIS